MNKLTIGTLAKRTGVSVRMLRHYDEIGLVRPAERSDAGYRLYGIEEVRRLQAIVVLRQMGLGLEAIGRVISGDTLRPIDAVAMRLEQLDAEIAQRQRLHRRLTEIAQRIQASHGGSLDELVESVEVMNTTDRLRSHFTAEELEELAQRRQVIGDAGMQQAQVEWTQLVEEVKQLVASGVPPSDPRARSAAERWWNLVESFTGGNPAIAASLQKVWEQEEELGHIETSDVRALFGYIEAARQPV
ncbi:MAG: MerR family transcriptional regulator [Thermomicrobiales bacterium]